MNSDKAFEIFNRALDLADPAGRLGYLKCACGDDADLLAHVQKLLAAHEGAEAAFPTDPDDDATLVDDTVPLAEGPGDTIGKYKLLQQIGEGGMGVVYMAEQSVPFNKRVALKIIKLGMDTKAVVARFEVERQALALMNHPNIAKVLDAGATDTGRPYFVMELVKGVPITEYCDKQKLSTKERLELFIPVCQAIQHAHQKGIIHRDIKPSNVMVALFDGRPVPMVIDFGIAKATNQRLTEQTVFTHLGRLIGTPAYMSPEQAEGSQLDIDTRSDIYSLGVLLYELLTGSQPFPEKQLRSAGWKEMIRIIQEDEPPRPSTRLSTLTDPEQSAVTGAHPEGIRKISLLLRRELDWIVMMCLEKDRAKRYETANGLAMDVARYLKGEAIVAVPPTWRYQLSKLARKHKKTFAMAAAIAVILALATVFSTWQMLRAKTAEQLASARAEKLAAINGWMNRDLLPQVNAWTGGQAGQQRNVEIKLKEAIVQSVQRLSEDFKDHPEIEGEIRQTVGTALRALGMDREAEVNLRRAIELLKATAGEKHTNTLSAQRALGALITYATYGQSVGWQRELGIEAQQLLENVHAQSVEILGLRHPFSVESALELARHHAAFSRLDKSDNLAQSLEAALGETIGGNADYPAELQLRFANFLFELRAQQSRLPEARVINRARVAYANRPGSITSEAGMSSMDRIMIALSNGWLTWQWDQDATRAEALLLAGLDQCRREVGLGPPGDNFLNVLCNMYGDFASLEKHAHYSRLNADLHVKTFGPNGGNWVNWSLNRAAGSHTRLADWANAAAELKRQRTELGVKEGWMLVTESLMCSLAGDGDGATKRREDYLQVLSDVRNGASLKDYNAHPANRSAIEAMLTFPCSTAELELLSWAVKESIRSDQRESWFIDSRAGEVMEGMLAYRAGQFEGAVASLEPALAAVGSHRVTIPAHYVLAMAQFQAGRVSAAEQQLARAERFMNVIIAAGVTGSAGPQSEFAAMALALREETAKVMRLPSSLPVISKETLETKRAAWNEMRAFVENGNMQARRRQYRNAATSYAAAMAHPAFHWQAPGDDRNFALSAFTVAWALGDEAEHIRILRAMHEGLGDGETRFLYQLAEVTWGLPPDLKRRRESSQTRRELEERGANSSQQFDGLRGAEDALILGMLAYREGNHEKALKFLQRPTDSSVLYHRVAGPAFAAMAHEKLGHNSEARRLLKQADERFHQMVIEPGEGMYPPTFSTCIMMEMIIKEADQLIDANDVNAPRVAALPKEGW